jgi:hypothetical protein
VTSRIFDSIADLLIAEIVTPGLGLKDNAPRAALEWNVDLREVRRLIPHATGQGASAPALRK